MNTLELCPESENLFVDPSMPPPLTSAAKRGPLPLAHPRRSLPHPGSLLGIATIGGFMLIGAAFLLRRRDQGGFAGQLARQFARRKIGS